MVLHNYRQQNMDESQLNIWAKRLVTMLSTLRAHNNLNELGSEYSQWFCSFQSQFTNQIVHPSSYTKLKSDPNSSE